MLRGKDVNQFENAKTAQSGYTNGTLPGVSGFGSGDQKRKLEKAGTWAAAGDRMWKG